MKTNSNYNRNLNEIKIRKARIKEKIELQRQEIFGIANELQQDLSPQRLVESVSNGFIASTSGGNFSQLIMSSLLKNVHLITQLFTKKSRNNVLIKLITPALITLLPMIIEWVRKIIAKRFNK